MGIKSVRRKKLKHVFTGGKLYRHYKGMAQTGRPNYLPPTFYDALKDAPPLPGPFGSPYPGKVTFPDDRLKMKIEIHTEHGKDVTKYGMSPIPWWFMERPIDQAVYRVKEIMQHNPELTEEEALEEWDWEYHRMKRIREKELELLNSNAKKNGTHLTILDSFNLIRAMKDLQIESNSIKEYRIQRSRKEQSGITFDKEFVLPTPLLDLTEFKKSKFLHLLFNSSQMRKFVQALELKDLVLNIIQLRAIFGPHQKFVPPTHFITEQEYVEIFVKAFEVDKVPATSPEWGKDRLEFSGLAEGETIYEMIKGKYAIFKEKFLRFSAIVEVFPDFGKIYSKINLGFEENPFSSSNYLDPYDKAGLPRVDITRIVQLYHTKKGFNTLLSYQKDIHRFIEYCRLTYVVKHDHFVGYRPNYILEKESDAQDIAKLTEKMKDNYKIELPNEDKTEKKEVKEEKVELTEEEIKANQDFESIMNSIRSRDFQLKDN